MNFFGKFPDFLIMKFINENMYWHGNCRLSVRRNILDNSNLLTMNGIHTVGSQEWNRRIDLS